MEEKLITFETAKLAKENGFDVIQTYGQASSLYNNDGKHTYYMNYGFMYSGLNEGYISAPTQSFLQKWLRENFEIIVLVEYIYDDEKNWYYTFPSNPRELSEDEYFDTYEEALESGLQEALKLIY